MLPDFLLSFPSPSEPLHLFHYQPVPSAQLTAALPLSWSFSAVLGKEQGSPVLSHIHPCCPGTAQADSTAGEVALWDVTAGFLMHVSHP